MSDWVLGVLVGVLLLGFGVLSGCCNMVLVLWWVGLGFCRFLDSVLLLFAFIN